MKDRLITHIREALDEVGRIGVNNAFYGPVVGELSEPSKDRIAGYLGGFLIRELEAFVDDCHRHPEEMEEQAAGVLRWAEDLEERARRGEL